MAGYVIEREAVEVETDAERRARVLEAAALEIELRGWARGDYCDQDGRLCGRGAISVALGLDLTYDTGTRDIVRFDELATRTFGANGDDIARFNDARGRTADEVTFLLRWRAEEIRDGR